VRAFCAGLAALAVVAWSGQALAFKNLEACDIVMAASGGAPLEIAPEAWDSYRDEVSTILHDTAGKDLSEAADRLLDAQASLLAPVAGSDIYKDYVAGESCLLLKSLSAQGVDAALTAADPSMPASVLANARAIANSARAHVEMISRSARFRSGRDQTLLAARYYCFAAGTIEALLAPDKQASVNLGTYGTTIGCKDAGRVE
jgi:hypothetical protein